MKQLLTLCICLLTLQSLIAQDKHFTQFYASPLTLNPALTGVFDGRYRVGAIYRDQWQRVLDQPYNTFAASLDLRLDIPNRTLAHDKVGVGLIFFRDNVPGVDFSTNMIAVSGAYHKSLNDFNTQYLSLGVQIGLAQRSLNYENLTFQDQWNGTTAYTGTSIEALPENNIGFSDINIGLNYTITNKKRASLVAGLALHHLLQPDISFYDKAKYPVNKIFSKLAGQLSGQLPLNKKITFLPRVLFSVQGESLGSTVSFKSGSHLEINAGGNLRFLLSNSNNTVAMQLGAWARPVRNEDNKIDLDAMVFLTGLEINGLLIGFSYDMNLADLNIPTKRNAFEISLVFLGEYENETILCPTW